MADLIDRAALLEKAGWVNLYGGNKSAYVVLVRDIHQLPAVDAVEVCRCRDCEWGGKCEVECLLREVDKIPNPYCAAGKRREDDATD